MIEYTFIKSRRKSISITVKPDGSVVVRAPLFCTKKRAEEFVLAKQDWIKKAQQKAAQRRSEYEEGTEGMLSQTEINALKKQAKKEIPLLVDEIAHIMGVSYNGIAIRLQKTRWGSCSSKGNLNFNCLLMLLPKNIQRYVVVHELCHRREMNHSKAFWDEVGKYQPTYKEDRKQLREMGRPLMERIR